ncbi:MAG: amino acid ABC transporter permease [Ruminococcaceae bacterium]|nr:amino acid ABC transporter permease [Oscillospiraceae bacterium]
MQFINIVVLPLLEGLLYTFLFFIITLIASLPLGLLISFGSKSKILPIRWAVRCLVWVIRGTPLMLQILFLITAPGLLSQVLGLGFRFAIREQWQYFMMVCVAFTINYSCYFSEIYRGGIQSVPAGQYEAAQVLGMTKSQTFSKVIFLQVVKRIVAPMSNEIITLVKDTALSSVAIHLDMFTVAKEIVNLQPKYFLWPLVLSAAFYLIFNGIVTVLLGKLEKKLDYFKV